MATPTKHSAEYWQRVATRWKVVALSALLALSMLIVLGGTLLWAGDAAKLEALRRWRTAGQEALEKFEKGLANDLTRMLRERPPALDLEELKALEAPAGEGKKAP